LRFDDRPALLSAVFVAPGGRMTAGVQAWRSAAASRSGLFVPSPSHRIRDEVVAGGGVTASGVELMAEPLRRAAQVAEQVVGGPVTDVRLVTPAGWGPQRLTLLRKAAHHAGLPAVTVVPAPVAVADWLAASGTLVPVGGYVAVGDLGGGVAATVLRRGADVFEIVSTLEDLAAGGLRLGDAVAAGLNGLAPPVAGMAVDPVWWQVLAAARTAVEDLSNMPAVTVSLPPPDLPVVLTAPTVQAHARPLWERAGRLMVEAVEAADLRPADLAGVFLAGGGAGSPQAAEAVGTVVGRPVQVVPEPAMAAVRGAAGVTDAPAAAGGVLPALSWLPELPLRRLLGVLVPAAASAGLFVEFLAVKARYPDLFPRASLGAYEQGAFGVVMAWGQLGMASLLALVACLCGAAVLAAVLPANTGVSGQPASEAVRMGGGLVVAAVLGSCIAALYGVGAAVYLSAPVGPFVRWALLCTLPLAAVAAGTGVLAAARGSVPAAGWHNWLRFPLLSAIPAAVGMLLLSAAHGYMAVDTGPTASVERTGGFLIGVGAGLALVRPLLYRLIVVPPLAAVTTAIVDIHTTGILAAFYIVAVTCWWLQRLWQLRFHPPASWSTDG